VKVSTVPQLLLPSRRVAAAMGEFSPIDNAPTGAPLELRPSSTKATSGRSFAPLAFPGERRVARFSARSVRSTSGTGRVGRGRRARRGGFTRATYDPVNSRSRRAGDGTRRAHHARGPAARRRGRSGSAPPGCGALYLGLDFGTRRRTAPTIRFPTTSGSRSNSPRRHGRRVHARSRRGGARRFEYRINRRWSVRIDANDCHTMRLGASTLDTLSGSIFLRYTWYSLWPQ
jgi:hypothetical protein